MKTLIVVNLDIEGVHRWAECPIEEVGFLRDYHRHLFKIRCEKEVAHDDRDIEIIMLKRAIADRLAAKFSTPCYFGDMSCEMVAKWLVNEFSLSSCEVLEDGENGAIVRI